MAKQESVIALANQHSSIFDAARMIGIHLEDYSGKVYCPFGEVYHMDGGASKTLRVYSETNSAHCFAGCGYLNPVRLVAMGRGISDESAAEALLEVSNYVPPDIDSRWAAIAAKADEVDTEALSQTLLVYCERIEPLWEVRQFDDDVSEVLQKCLGLVSRVKTKEESVQWLTTTKSVMAATLGNKR